MRKTNAKFEARFGFIETELARLGKSLGSVSLAEMDALWDEAKRQESEQENEVAVASIAALRQASS